MKTMKKAVTRSHRNVHEFALVGKVLVNLGYAHRWFNAYVCDDEGMEGNIYRITNGVAYCESNPRMAVKPEVKYAD